MLFSNESRKGGYRDVNSRKEAHTCRIEHGGFPLAAVTIDGDSGTVGNVSVNGTWFGVFDYIAKKFIQKAE